MVPTDSELVERVLNDDREAFTLLVRRYSVALGAAAYARLANAEDAQDAVQECFVIAYCSLSNLADRQKFGGWIRGILLNCCNKHVERQARTRRLLSLQAERFSAPDPQAVVHRRIVADKLRAALATLGEAQRETVLLHYFNDTPLGEVARLLGKPVGTVKRTLSDARGKLQEELIEMARSEFEDYRLTDEQKTRLERLPVFPREEPRVTVAPSSAPADPVRIQGPMGNFPALTVGSEAFYANYDYPSRQIAGISHAVVQGPFPIGDTAALRYDNLEFTATGKREGIWRPYYRVDDETWLYCAKQHGDGAQEPVVLTPADADWGEPVPVIESRVLRPGTTVDPTDGRAGEIVDASLWEVRIGRRAFQCVRRTSGGTLTECPWVGTPLANVACEEFFLPDGRLLLWRRYNGPAWGAANPRRRTKAGSYEHLTESGAPALELFGATYRLWYDQLPDYAFAG